MGTIGFFGLGHMGGPMAANLLKNGHAVIGSDFNPQNAQAFEAAGGKIATLEEIARISDVIILVLPTAHHVANLCQGENGKKGLFELAQPNTLIINCSTIDIITAKLLAKDAVAHQMAMLDAPISGGSMGAEAGTMTFMVGGEKEDFERAKPILMHMGKSIFYVGQSGNGSAVKICNNMLVGISFIAVGEAFNLAQKLGVDPQTFYDVVSTSTGQCWVLSNYCPVPGIVANSPASHDYEPGAAVTTLLKDLKLSQAAAQQSDISTPLGALATALYEMFNQQGFGMKDQSAIIQMLAGHAN